MTMANLSLSYERTFMSYSFINVSYYSTRTAAGAQITTRTKTTSSRTSSFDPSVTRKSLGKAVTGYFSHLTNVFTTYSYAITSRTSKSVNRFTSLSHYLELFEAGSAIKILGATAGDAPQAPYLDGINSSMTVIGPYLSIAELNENHFIWYSKTNTVTSNNMTSYSTFNPINAAYAGNYWSPGGAIITRQYLFTYYYNQYGSERHMTVEERFEMRSNAILSSLYLVYTQETSSSTDITNTIQNRASWYWA